MRVALFTSAPVLGSDSEPMPVTRLLRHLTGRHTSLLFAPTRYQWRYAQTHIVPAAGPSIPFLPGRCIRPLRTDPAHELREYAPDVCHIIDPLGHDGLAYRYAQRTDTPLVVTVTERGISALMRRNWPWRRLQRLTALRWMSRADRVICHSQRCLRTLRDQGIAHARLLPQGIDTELFTPTSRSQAWRSLLSRGKPDQHILLYVGPLDDNPRLDWLRSVLNGLPDACLAIVGAGPRDTYWKRAFAGAPAAFFGSLENKDLARVMAASDLLVLPAAHDNDSLTILRAMASGLPVIGPRDGIVRECVNNDQNGYLFEPNNPVDLMVRVLQATSQQHRLLRLSAQSRQMATQHGWPRVLEQIVEQYLSVTKPSRQGEPEPQPESLAARLASPERIGDLILVDEVLADIVGV